MMEPVKKRDPDTDVGIQNDLPTPRCLMALRVLRLTAVKTAAIDATANSSISINVSSQGNVSSFFEEKLCELTVSISGMWKDGL